MIMTSTVAIPYTELSESSVGDLVLQAQSGDRSAMDQLYCRFQQHVLSIAYKRLGNWDEAQELSQDVFIQAFRRLNQLQAPEAHAPAHIAWLPVESRLILVGCALRDCAIFA